MDDKAELALNTEHSNLAAFALWNALGTALREIGRNHPNDQWKAPLLAECLQYIDNLKDVSKEGDPARLAELERMVSPEAKDAARRAVISAFDRIYYIESSEAQ